MGASQTGGGGVPYVYLLVKAQAAGILGVGRCKGGAAGGFPKGSVPIEHFSKVFVCYPAQVGKACVQKQTIVIV